MTGKSRSKSTKSKSSRRWLDRQHSDYYTQLAREKGYRSRSAYKLLEIQEKDKIIFIDRVLTRWTGLRLAVGLKCLLTMLVPQAKLWPLIFSLLNP